MEPLLRQLRELPARLAALPAATRALLAGVGVLLVVVVAAFALLGRGPEWQYAFTNLAPDDGAEALATLKAAGVPSRLEAGGAALAVPGDRVLDARLLLAGSGLPRSGGVGFELFDRSDFGASEFTQHVNLRRALEGELARTIGRLAEVQSARVHLTLPEKGLYRDEDRQASAAVVLTLRAGRVPEARSVAGIRHLVASAVPGLSPQMVTVVDTRGGVLSDDGAPGAADGLRRSLERDLEQRVVGLLEPVAGSGAVVARVSLQLDETEVSTSAEVFDPEAVALRSERHSTGSQSQESARPPGSAGAGGVAGAAGNQPDSAAPPAAAGARGAAQTEEEQKNYEISHTTTTTVARAPRIRRLSAAVLVDGVDGKPRPDADLARLGELARRALGFDTARGDQFTLTSAVFAKAEAAAEAAPAATASALPPSRTLLGAGAAALLLALGAAVFFALRGGRRAPDLDVLRPGAVVSEAESALARPGTARPPDPELALREQARTLASADPARAARLLRSWITADTEPAKEIDG